MQQINLYIPPPPPKKIFLPFNVMLVIFISFTILLFLIFGFNYLSNKKIQAEVSVMEQQQSKLLEEIGFIKENLPSEKEQQEMLQKYDRLQQIKNLNEQIFSELNKLRGTEDVRFSSYLYSIAKTHVSGIWFTKFEFLNGGRVIVLEGKSERAALIPILIEKLGNEKTFKDKSFESLNVSFDDEKKIINFSLYAD